jgi:hypothetical protein
MAKLRAKDERAERARRKFTEEFKAGAVARDDVWAVADGGTILHFDGTQWSAATSTTSQTLRAVWAIAADDV